MANYTALLDQTFDALGDATRRSVVVQLGHGPASVSELARGHAMALPSFMKHIRVLENSGLITTRKSGRVRTCSLNRDRLNVISGWLSEQRDIWEGRTDRLERLVTEEGDQQ